MLLILELSRTVKALRSVVHKAHYTPTSFTMLPVAVVGSTVAALPIQMSATTRTADGHKDRFDRVVHSLAISPEHPSPAYPVSSPLVAPSMSNTANPGNALPSSVPHPTLSMPSHSAPHDAVRRMVRARLDSVRRVSNIAQVRQRGGVEDDVCTEGALVELEREYDIAAELGGGVAKRYIEAIEGFVRRGGRLS